MGIENGLTFIDLVGKSLEKMKLMLLALLLLLSAEAPYVCGVTVQLTPKKDTSIFQEIKQNSNGAGTSLFAGVPGSGSAIRSLLKFPILQSIPSGSTINSATLTLYCEQSSGSSPGPVDFEIYKLKQTFGEKDPSPAVVKELRRKKVTLLGRKENGEKNHGKLLEEP